MRPQRLQFGAEQEVPVLPPVVKRLLSHPVADQNQFVVHEVDKRNGEHSVGPLYGALDAPGITRRQEDLRIDRKSTRLNSSHLVISYAVFCLKKKKANND